MTAIRLNTGLAHVQLSGYEVFYQLGHGNSSVMSAGTTTKTMLNITSGLVVGETFNFFVVSYGSEGNTVLPSDHSNITNYVFCECVIVSLDYFLWFIIL